MSPDTIATPRPRYRLIDAARGVAILAMVVFHCAWDLYFLGYINLDISTDPFWTAFQKAIVSSFLLLTGVSLWLGHRGGINWRRFWRREAVLVAASVAVSIGTWLAFGDYFAFFGVLHAIALFSLLALPFLKLRPWLTALVGVAIIVLPLMVTHPVMRERWLAWIGFWPISPSTADIVPVFPWLGVTLLGLAMAKALDGRRFWRTPAPKWLASLGRWSLVIYLVHQPLIYGSLYGLSMIMPAVSEERRAEDFVQNCRATQLGAGIDALTAERYCGCALEQVETGAMWEMLTRERTAAEELEVQGMMGLCQAMSREPIPVVPTPQ
ncbi:MAG: DUF1624 domain-containing protein [Hyphomicrobiales bacterium]|nr:MAG: DUF1624 domain-containing protein [Hyphomicrobiales bacterium]